MIMNKWKTNYKENKRKQKVGYSVPLGYSANVNWRSRMSPIQSQGRCGSCVIFATLSVFESRASIAHNDRLYKLSEQHLLDCSVAKTNPSLDLSKPFKGCKLKEIASI